MAHDYRILTYCTEPYYSNICMSWVECGSGCAKSSYQPHFVHSVNFLGMLLRCKACHVRHSDVAAVVCGSSCLGGERYSLVDTLKT